MRFTVWFSLIPLASLSAGQFTVPLHVMRPRTQSRIAQTGMLGLRPRRQRDIGVLASALRYLLSNGAVRSVVDAREVLVKLVYDGLRLAGHQVGRFKML